MKSRIVLLSLLFVASPLPAQGPNRTPKFEGTIGKIKEGILWENKKLNWWPKNTELRYGRHNP